MAQDKADRAALARLLEHYSVEVTTRDHASLDAAGDLLPRETRVFIASFPKDNVDHFISGAVKLHRAGMIAVPHIVARNIPSRAVLDDMLARLSGEAGVDRAHIVGGDRDKPAGEYDAALQLIETGLFEKYGVTRIALACYPEGHPRIPDSVLEEARVAKMKATADHGLSVWMVSQFAFESAPIVALARQMRAQGIDVPYRAGIAGPADRTILLKYAMLCGVGASLRALKERGGLGRSVLFGETPERLLTEIALAREAEPELGIDGIHFFTFGAMANTAKWVERVKAG